MHNPVYKKISNSESKNATNRVRPLKPHGKSITGNDDSAGSAVLSDIGGLFHQYARPLAEALAKNINANHNAIRTYRNFRPLSKFVIQRSQRNG